MDGNNALAVKANERQRLHVHILSSWPVDNTTKNGSCACWEREDLDAALSEGECVNMN